MFKYKKESFLILSLTCLILLFIQIKNQKYLDSDNKNNIKNNTTNFIINQSFQNENRKIKIIIASLMRSGSTFLGDAINAHPNIFYHFEPLIVNQTMNLYDTNSAADNAISQVSNFLNCKYEDLTSLVEQINIKYYFIWTLNNKLAQSCNAENLISRRDPKKPNKTKDAKNSVKLSKLQRKKLEKAAIEKCTKVENLTGICTKYSIQLAKLVRMPLAYLEDFMENDKDTYVIHLIRDPRGSISSRLQTNWCKDYCSDFNRICAQLEKNFYSYNYLKNKYPEQIFEIQYEELAKTPFLVIKNLFKSIGLAWDSSVANFIKIHTQETKALQDKGMEGLNTFRKSKDNIDKWKDKLDFDTIFNIEKACKRVLKFYEYDLFAINKNNTL